jgi:5'-nucleotidase
MQILVTNDDGIRAPGLAVLARLMAAFGEVTVCAPENEQSAVGRALTMNRPLRMEEAHIHGLEMPCWAVDGTPTDCAKLAMDKLFDAKPDLLVSGINQGSNLGTDVLFSGTVSAAMEGALQGVHSMAVSLRGYENQWDFEAAACWASKVISIAKGCTLPFGTLLNINIPSGTPRGIQIAKMGLLDYTEEYVRRRDPGGRNYYWLSGDKLPAGNDTGTDDAWLEAGYITITPLKFDLTDYSALDHLRSLFDGFDENLNS